MKAPDHQLEDTREETAAQWLARRDRKLSEPEAAAFAAWLAEDARNGEVLRELEESFYSLDCIETLKSPATRPDPDFLLKPAGAKTERRASSRIVSFKFWIAAGAAVAALVMLTFTLSRRPVTSEPQLARTNGTVVRHIARTMALPDGSVIELKPGANVDVLFQPAERRVRLTAGEAHFTVAKDASRPFVVSVNDLSVRAVGTAFNVRLRDSAVEVLVTEGKVALQDTASAGGASSNDIDIPLVAGNRAVVSSQGENRVAVASIEPGDVDRELAWRSVWLEFVEMQLGDVVTEFNRYNNQRLEVADEATRSVLVTGNFKADGAEAFVRILESTFGVAAERREDAVVLTRR